MFNWNPGLPDSDPPRVWHHCIIEIVHEFAPSEVRKELYRVICICHGREHPMHLDFGGIVQSLDDIS